MKKTRVERLHDFYTKLNQMYFSSAGLPQEPQTLPAILRSDRKLCSGHQEQSTHHSDLTQECCKNLQEFVPNSPSEEFRRKPLKSWLFHWWFPMPSLTERWVSWMWIWSNSYFSSSCSFLFITLHFKIRHHQMWQTPREKQERPYRIGPGEQNLPSYKLNL